MSTSERNNDTSHRERALSLLRYLQEYVKLRATVVRSVEEYRRDGLVVWFGELPQDEGCASPFWTGMGEGRQGTWLEVEKQRLAPVPELPVFLRPWVDAATLADSSGDEPHLRQVAYLERSEEGDRGTRGAVGDGDIDAKPLLDPHDLSDHPEVVERWERYIESWRAWASQHRRRSAIQKLYSELFHAYQSQRRLGEAFEFCVGLGLLVWKTPQGQSVRRHVVTAQAELKFDEKRGVIAVECPPPPEGARLRLEDEFLEPTEHPAKEFYESAEAQLAEIGDAIWDRDRMEGMLRAWSTALHPDAEYSATLDPPRGTSSQPRVVFAPALLLRKRTVRGTLAIYAKIIRQLETGGEVPFGFRRLVDHLEDRGLDQGHDVVPRQEGAGAEAAEEVLFPLPANDEQRRIVEELGRRQGVLVQGPPGTGKSQTIANLICHFLAYGKRVLVTSETPRALRVLKSKVPQEVQPLCVSLLGADTASFSELETSINGVSQRYARWRREISDNSIRRLEANLQSSCARKAAVESELRRTRESETYPITLAEGRYRGTAAAIARQVNEERKSYGWLSLLKESPSEPPLSDRQALRLLEVLRAILPARRTEITRPIANLASLPSAEAVAELVRVEAEARAHAESYSKLQAEAAYEPLLSSAPERRARLRHILENFVEKRRAAMASSEEWIPRAVREVLAEQEAAWGVRADRTREGLHGLEGAARESEAHGIQLPKDRELEEVLADARQVHDHLSSGGRWSLAGIPVGPAWGRSYLKKQSRVDGRPANSLQSLAVLIQVLETTQQVQRLWRIWRGLASPRSEGLETQVAELSEHLEALEAVLALLELARSAAAVLGESPRLSTPEWNSDLSRGPWKLLRRHLLMAGDHVTTFTLPRSRIRARC